jgi:hypothetical protein
MWPTFDAGWLATNYYRYETTELTMPEIDFDSMGAGLLGNGGGGGKTMIEDEGVQISIADFMQNAKIHVGGFGYQDWKSVIRTVIVHQSRLESPKSMKSWPQKNRNYGDPSTQLPQRVWVHAIARSPPVRYQLPQRLNSGHCHRSGRASDVFDPPELVEFPIVGQLFTSRSTSALLQLLVCKSGQNGSRYFGVGDYGI